MYKQPGLLRILIAIATGGRIIVDNVHVTGFEHSALFPVTFMKPMQFAWNAYTIMVVLLLQLVLYTQVHLVASSIWFVFISLSSWDWSQKVCDSVMTTVPSMIIFALYWTHTSEHTFSPLFVNRILDVVSATSVMCTSQMLIDLFGGNKGPV